MNAETEVLQGSNARSLPTQEMILQDLSRLYKIQPATALWRAVEIHEVLKLGLPEGRGLDLGCGDGALTGLILQYLGRSGELIGLDYDPGEIEVAKRRGIYSKTFVSGGEEMPLDDHSFDFVFSNSVLEHLTQLEDTVAECTRVLRPGGALIATVPEPGFRNLLRAKGLTGGKREAYLKSMDDRLAHHNYLDVDGWAEIGKRHGLVLDHAAGYLDRRQVERWEKLSSLTAGVLQKLGASNALLYRLQRFTRSDDKSAGGVLDTDKPLPNWARHWARVIGGGVLNDRETDGDHGCLIIRLTKPV